MKIIHYISLLIIALTVVPNAYAIHKPEHKFICSFDVFNPANTESDLIGQIKLCPEFISKGGGCEATINQSYFGEANVKGPNADGICSLSPPLWLLINFSAIKPEGFGKNVPFNFTYSPSGCILGDTTCSETVKSSVIIDLPAKKICSFELKPTSEESNISAKMSLCKKLIGIKDGKCSLRLNEKPAQRPWHISGPNADGICEVTVRPDEFSQYGITEELYGKNIPISVTFSPIGCNLDEQSCSETVKDIVLIQKTKSASTPSKLICSLDTTNPATTESGISAFIMICPEFVGVEGGRCIASINEISFEKGHISGPNSDGTCKLFVHPDEYFEFGIKPTDSGKAIPITITFSPSGCVTGDPACSETVKDFVVLGKEETKPTEKEDKEGKEEKDGKSPIEIDVSQLELIISDLISLREDLLAEFEETPVRALQIVANKINKVVRHVNKAIEHALEGEPEPCDDDLSDAATSLEKVIDLFESRQCRSTRLSRRCIPKEIVQTYLPDFEDLFDLIEETVSIDDNEDGLADVCGSLDSEEGNKTSEGGDCPDFGCKNVDTVKSKECPSELEFYEVEGVIPCCCPPGKFD